MTKITVLGGSGRMGRAVADAAAKFGGIEIVAQVGRQHDLKPAIDACDVVVDFSSPAFSLVGVRLATTLGKPSIVGTTGFEPHQEAELRNHSKTTPIVKAANFSLGITVVAHLCGILTRLLGDAYDVELVEMHHRGKRDAPGGTALLLAGAVASARAQEIENAAIYGRVGMEPRKQFEIGIHSLRGGDVAGEHTVCFADTGERVEIVHRATDRACFATGALRAAEWIRHKAPGLYGMKDVLGI